MRRWKGEDIAHRSKRSRHGTMNKETVEPPRLRLIGHDAAGHQSPDLGSKLKDAVLPRPVKRLYSEAIFGEKELWIIRCTEIKDRESKHTAKAWDYFFPPF